MYLTIKRLFNIFFSVFKALIIVFGIQFIFLSLTQHIKSVKLIYDTFIRNRNIIKNKIEENI